MDDKFIDALIDSPPHGLHERHWRFFKMQLTEGLVKIGMTLENLAVARDFRSFDWLIQGYCKCPCGGTEVFTFNMTEFIAGPHDKVRFDNVVADIVFMLKAHILKEVRDGVLPPKWEQTIKEAA